MRAYLLFGYYVLEAPKITIEARHMVRHGVTYLMHEKRFYRLRKSPTWGTHVFVHGERVKVSLVED